MPNKEMMLAGAKVSGGLVVFSGIILLILAPIIGDNLFNFLWGVEPLTYLGTILLLVGLGLVAGSYVIPSLISRLDGRHSSDGSEPGDGAEPRTVEQQWSQVTQRYFDLFDHDLSRPLRRILGKNENCER